jgi:hypothetical protein
VTDDVYRISLSDWKCGEVVPGNSSHVSFVDLFNKLQPRDLINPYLSLSD